MLTPTQTTRAKLKRCNATADGHDSAAQRSRRTATNSKRGVRLSPSPRHEPGLRKEGKQTDNPNSWAPNGQHSNQASCASRRSPEKGEAHGLTHCLPAVNSGPGPGIGPGIGPGPGRGCSRSCDGTALAGCAALDGGLADTGLACSQNTSRYPQIGNTCESFTSTVSG